MQTVTTEKPQEVLKMFTFKPDPLTEDKDKMETVIATSLAAAVQKNPDMLKWYLHSITK
jgi:hypothetical protein